MILDGFLSICGMRQKFQIVSVPKFWNWNFFPGTKRKIRERNFFRERNKKLQERNFLSGKTQKVSMAASCQTFQFQNFGTETFSIVRFHHVKSFSSKISELKLSRWLDFIMSNLSVPKFRNWNSLDGWISSCQTFQFQNFGTETLLMVGFDHVEPFSSKILELKLSRWFDLIMSSLSVPKFRNWNLGALYFYFRIFGTDFFLEKKTIGLNFNILELYVMKGKLNVS